MGSEWRVAVERTCRRESRKTIAIQRAERVTCDRPSEQSLERLALKQKEQLDQQNQHHRCLKNECPALVKLLEHVVVQVFGGFELLRNQILVVGHTHFAGRELVQTRREH